jgi:hypothetical protein
LQKTCPTKLKWLKASKCKMYKLQIFEITIQIFGRIGTWFKIFETLCTQKWICSSVHCLIGTYVCRYTYVDRALNWLTRMGAFAIQRNFMLKVQPERLHNVYHILNINYF